MSLIFARQPIFDLNNNVYGYELLYREEGKLEYDCANGDVASSNVMAGAFFSMNVGEIVGHRKAFINFTENMVLQKVATLFPSEQIIVEIPETIEPTKELIEACRSLKSDGYVIALDDFTFRPGYEALIDIADIIKVDFLQTVTESDRRYVIKHFRNRKLKFLAEKVETREDFRMAQHCGYGFFQGYYFSKPVIVSPQGIPSAKMNHIRLIKAIESKEPSFEEISRIIESDVAFSYEILKIANTTRYYRGNAIRSIRQAAILMGLEELKKWAFITILRKMGGNGQEETVNLSVQRAKALELLGQNLGFEEKKMEYFTLGMLSMIDTLTGCPMEKVLVELSIPDEIVQILLGNHNDGKMSLCFRLVLAYENGEWILTAVLSEKLSLSMEVIADLYFKALVWINSTET